MKTSSSLTLPLALLLALLGLTLAAPSPALGKDPKKKKEKEEIPEPSDEERLEIRQLMGRVGRARHPAKRSQAATQLAAFGPKAAMAVPQLAHVLNDRDANAACAAAFALGKVGTHSKPAVKALLRALSSGKSPELKRAAAEGLGLIGPNAAGAGPALVKALGSKDPDLRAKAAEALGLLGEKVVKKASKPLRGALSDEETSVRLNAAIALVRLGESGEELVKTLAAAVRKSGRAIVGVRQAACEALGTLGKKAEAAVEALAGAAAEATTINKALPYAEQRKKQHEAMRQAAVDALGEIGGDQARASLERLADVPCLSAAVERAQRKLAN